MKGHLLVYLLVALLLPTYTHAAMGCNPRAQKRVVIGRQPTANTLYAHIQGVGAGSWQVGFDTETFVYVGDVHTKSGKTYEIGHLKTIAGRQCIEFDRLFIFDAKHNYLGQYAPVQANPKDIEIEGSMLVFPFAPKDGNTLDLNQGPPAEAMLDGENESWSPAPTPAPVGGTAPSAPNPGAAPTPADSGSAPSSPSFVVSLAKTLSDNALFAGLLVLFIGAIFAAGMNAWRNQSDSQKIYEFLVSSKKITGHTYRSTEAIASNTKLSEARVEKLCSRHPKIRRNEKERQTWTLEKS